jgi:hypothetical protein
MKLVVEAITVGGGLPEFPGVSCCGSAFSVPVGSVSTSEVLRGAKNLRTNTAFGGSLTAEDIGTVLVDFLADYEVSLELCPLRFFTSWKSSPLAIDSYEVLFSASQCLACALTAFICYRVHAVKRAKKQLPI